MMDNGKNTFGETAKRHLAQYKTLKMGISAHGVYKRYRRPYPHILPEEQKRSNILEPFRDDFGLFFDTLGRDGISLHPDFHHLNSSQAVCFNLFYPFIYAGRQQLPLLLQVLGFRQDEVCEAGFEKVLDSKEGTNFDFYLRYQDGQQVMVELKYTEDVFGGAKNDAHHQRKYKDVYLPLLAGVVRPEKLSDPVFFLKNYQLLRNLAYLKTHDTNVTVFVVPEQNTPLVAVLKVLLEEIVCPEYLHRVKVCYMEDLVRQLAIASRGVDERISRHLEVFQEKYLDISQ